MHWQLIDTKPTPHAVALTLPDHGAVCAAWHIATAGRNDPCRYTIRQEPHCSRCSTPFREAPEAEGSGECQPCLNTPPRCGGCDTGIPDRDSLLCGSCTRVHIARIEARQQCRERASYWSEAGL